MDVQENDAGGGGGGDGGRVGKQRLAVRDETCDHLEHDGHRLKETLEQRDVPRLLGDLDLVRAIPAFIHERNGRKTGGRQARRGNVFGGSCVGGGCTVGRVLSWPQPTRGVARLPSLKTRQSALPRVLRPPRLRLRLRCSVCATATAHFRGDPRSIPSRTAASVRSSVQGTASVWFPITHLCLDS